MKAGTPRSSIRAIALSGATPEAEDRVHAETVTIT
jgi:hypothetical protein